MELPNSESEFLLFLTSSVSVSRPYHFPAPPKYHWIVVYGHEQVPNRKSVFKLSNHIVVYVSCKAQLQIIQYWLHYFGGIQMAGQGNSSAYKGSATIRIIFVIAVKPEIRNADNWAHLLQAMTLGTRSLSSVARPLWICCCRISCITGEREQGRGSFAFSAVWVLNDTHHFCFTRLTRTRRVVRPWWLRNREWPFLAGQPPPSSGSIPWKGKHWF